MLNPMAPCITCFYDAQVEHIVEEQPAGTPELTELLDAAFAELVSRYGAEGRSPVQTGARYFVVRNENRQAVGCAALQVHDGAAEIKRMYVAPHARGRGCARALLKALEDAAGAAGHAAVRLATGDLQPAAIALYRSSGYVQSAAWGKYAHQPGTLCFTKVFG
jgi:GNAT superfamily N-acetyltransferase